MWFFLRHMTTNPWQMMKHNWYVPKNCCMPNVEPLPPLASFYRHNNFGREVLVVDTVSDSLSLARYLSLSPSLPSSPSLTPSHTRTHTHSRTRSLTRSLCPHPYALICPVRFFHITHLFSWHLIHAYLYFTIHKRELTWLLHTCQFGMNIQDSDIDLAAAVQDAQKEVLHTYECVMLRMDKCCIIYELVLLHHTWIGKFSHVASHMN